MASSTDNAASLQESKLQNLDYGDRDSEGLFQQRTSVGWGTIAEITDPVKSSEVCALHVADELLYVRVASWQGRD